MTPLTCRIDRRDLAEIERYLAGLHDPKEYQRISRKAGGYVRTLARQNIRKQRNIDGSAFAPREKSRSGHRVKRRLLQGLADPADKGRSMSVISRAAQGGGVAVGWRNPLTAQIAYRQQYGTGTKSMNAGLLKKEQKSKHPFYDEPCTRAQAKALIAAGYRLMVPAPGGGRGPGRNKRPLRVSVQWLERHFTVGHAGLVLRILRTARLSGKKSWSCGINPRAFLGVNGKQAEEISSKISQSLLDSIK